MVMMVRLPDSNAKVRILTAILEGFIEDEPFIESDTPQRRFAAMGENSNREGGWVDVTIASLMERYGPKHHEAIAGDTSELEQPLASNSAFASTIDKIARWPTNDDYPLWRVRCKVFFTHIFFDVAQLRVPLSSRAWKKRSYLLYFSW